MSKLNEYDIFNEIEEAAHEFGLSRFDANRIAMKAIKRILPFLADKTDVATCDANNMADHSPPSVSYLPMESCGTPVTARRDSWTAPAPVPNVGRPPTALDIGPGASGQIIVAGKDGKPAWADPQKQTCAAGFTARAIDLPCEYCDRYVGEHRGPVHGACCKCGHCPSIPSPTKVNATPDAAYSAFLKACETPVPIPPQPCADECPGALLGKPYHIIGCPNGTVPMPAADGSDDLGGEGRTDPGDE